MLTKQSPLCYGKANIRKAMTERVVYRQHSERVADGASHLCEMFTKTSPELLRECEDLQRGYARGFSIEVQAVCLR